MAGCAQGARIVVFSTATFMDSTSINRLFRAGKLKRDAFGPNVLRPGKPLHIARPLDAEILEGRHEGRARKGSGGGSQALSAGLQKRLGKSRHIGTNTSRRGAGKFAFDTRQRAIVKIHYFSHAGAGGAGLRAHARYVARDAATRETTAGARAIEETADHAERGDGAKARAHARYLSRELSGAAERAVFYDADRAGLDGGAKAAEWAREDRRHFRIILAAENGSGLDDLKGFTRAVMAKAEAALGTRLEWVAVDHWDTDNPHTHIILRGKRQDGRDLIIPPDYVKHGFRSAARDVATARLGARTRADERLALARDVRAHRPTRLDQLIAAQLPEGGTIRITQLRASSPELADALKGRAHELRRLGLAIEVRRNVLRFQPGWRDALKAMEMHLDIRKSLMRERTQDVTRRLAEPAHRLLKGLQPPMGDR